MMRRLPRWMIGAFVLETVAFVVVATLLLDMTVHARVAGHDGVNRWGYRGPIVRRRQPRENRLVVVGGSAAFGYGRPFDETFPAYLERNLQQRWRTGFRGIPVTVINLAAVPDDAASFLRTLRDYEPLDYDIVCFYDAYNSLAPPLDENGWRRKSFVFRHSGYLPILPSILARESPIGVPRVGEQNAVAARAAAGPDAATSCDGRPEYCDAMERAVAFVIESGRTALVVTPPVLSPQHAEQQRAAADTLMRRFGGESRFRHLSAASLVDMHDRTVSFDGVHLTALGNDRVADFLTGPVLQLLH